HCCHSTVHGPAGQLSKPFLPLSKGGEGWLHSGLPPPDGHYARQVGATLSGGLHRWPLGPDEGPFPPNGPLRPAADVSVGRAAVEASRFPVMGRRIIEAQPHNLSGLEDLTPSASGPGTNRGGCQGQAALRRWATQHASRNASRSASDQVL